MLDSIHLVFRNLSLQKLRTLLTISGVFIGVLSVILVSCIGQSGTGAITAELESLGINGITISVLQEYKNRVKFENEELMIIRQCEDVKNATPVMMQTAEIESVRCQKPAFLWGIDTTAENIIAIEVLYGRMLQKSDILSCSKVCLVDENFAQKAYGRSNVIGKSVFLQGFERRESYTIIGVVKTGSGLLQNFIGEYIPTFVYIPYTSFQDLWNRSNFDQIAIQLKSTKNTKLSGNSIISSLERNLGNTEVYTSNDLAKQRDQLSQMFEIISTVLTAVGGISLIVSNLSIMTIMLISVNERTREIGIKKAVGASKRKIITEFLIEAVCIAALGSAAGIIFGYAIVYAGSISTGIPLNIAKEFIGWICMFTVVSAIIFGIYPAIKAAQLKPVEALRQE